MAAFQKEPKCEVLSREDLPEVPILQRQNEAGRVITVSMTQKGGGLSIHLLRLGDESAL